MTTRHDKKINKRLERLIASPVEVTKCGSIGHLDIITQRDCKGLGYNGNRLIAPVYDDITANAELPVAAVMIDNQWALIDINTADLLTDFEYDNIEFSPNTHSIIVVKNGQRGLFDVAARRIVRQASYNEISHTPGRRYTWAYSPADGYEFFDSQTGQTIRPGHSVQQCFDEAYGHIFVVRDGKVQMLNDDGLSDPIGYRRLLASLNGRLKLYNSTRGVSATADIYGEIL